MQRRRGRVCCAVKEGQEREVAWVMGLARAVVVLYSMLDVMAETQSCRRQGKRGRDDLIVLTCTTHAISYGSPTQVTLDYYSEARLLRLHINDDSSKLRLLCGSVPWYSSWHSIRYLSH
jgi:hypothetical protein